jgi:ribosomal-protein-alanine N-acetyltransferase
MNDTEPIEFVRLTQIDTASLSQLVDDPRVRRHMPLSQGAVSDEWIREWVRAKEAIWADLGFGPWGIRIGGAFAGWGGLQPWNDEVEIALVLKPDFWGYGRAILERCLTYAFTELHLTHVLALLPPTRGTGRALLRLGFFNVGTSVVDGEQFMVYRKDGPSSGDRSP